MASSKPFHWHLKAELARLASALQALLRSQRDRGRSPLADAVGGMAIEEGEAEGLVEALLARWSSEAVGAAADPLRRSIAEQADALAREGQASPLRAAAQAFDLGDAELDALLLALAVEVDGDFARLVAYLNDHAGHVRPTLGLACALAAHRGLALSPPLLLARPAVTDGLLVVEGDGPLTQRTLRVRDDAVAHLAHGWPRHTADSGVSVVAPRPAALRGIVASEKIVRSVRSWVAAVRAGGAPPPVVVAGRPAMGRATLAAAAAGEAGLALVIADLRGDAWKEVVQLARRELRWCGGRAALALRTTAGVPVPFAELFAAIADLPAPLWIVLPPEHLELALGGAPSDLAVIELEEPDAPSRVRLWRSALAGTADLSDDELEMLAARFRFGPGAIHRAVRLARSWTKLSADGQREPTASDLEHACREVGAAAMSSLAQKLPLSYRRQDLILPAHLEAEIDLATAWVRQQSKVLDRWGFSSRIAFGHGLTALFAGPPGTGKTMAAQVLARELGVEAFRVDLSRVMSKYIGETEKNLAQLFDQAHAAGALLFFDEADALFGKRSEVSDAHDRYANVEIGYLLQRMEQHDGVTVLATNRLRDLDEAFLRRFHFILDFPIPSEADRARIWEGLVPAEARGEVDLRTLARQYEISGGDIKNASLAAAYLAAAEGKLIGMRHLEKAVRRELVKSGKVIDEA